MSFDRSLALECAGLIESVYHSHFEPTISEPRTDTQVFITERNPGEMWIIFPGTASRQDCITDARVGKTEWVHAGRVHRGFMAAYVSVAPQIVAAIATAKRIVITGHSLGGALATLCADDLLNLNFPVSKVITFGSPRVGNGVFSRAYNTDLANLTARIVNAYDPVPHVPWLLGTYRHVDTQVYLAADGAVRIDEPLSVAAAEAAQSIATMVSGAEAKAALRLAEPHHITSYIRKLKGLPS